VRMRREKEWNGKTDTRDGVHIYSHNQSIDVNMHACGHCTTFIPGWLATYISTDSKTKIGTCQANTSTALPPATRLYLLSRTGLDSSLRLLCSFTASVSTFELSYLVV
jgi:hypothetical protein